jgi:hypothetical protein
MLADDLGFLALHLAPTRGKPLRGCLQLLHGQSVRVGCLCKLPAGTIGEAPPIFNRR